MDDQRRVFIAIAITLGLFFAWQALLKPTKTQPVNGGASQSAAREPIADGGRSGAASAPVDNKGVPGSGSGTTLTADNTTSEEQFAAFETSLFEGSLTSQGGLNKLLLKQYKEARTKQSVAEPVSLVTAALERGERQAAITISVGGVPVPLQFVERGPTQFVLEGQGGGSKARLTIKPRERQYALGYTLKVENQSAGPVKAAAAVSMGLKPDAMASEGSLFAPAADTISALCAFDGKVKRLSAKDVKDAPEQFSKAGWSGLDRQYFVVALVAEEGGADCKVHTRDTSVFVDYGLGVSELAPGQSWTKDFVLYLGPKRAADLEAVAPVLRGVIDYDMWGIPLGFLARPMVLVLNIFHGWTASWGLAIILLTFLVKTLLFPVTYKSVVSMRRMSLIRPEIEKLKERFGNDRERMQLEQVKLFRDKGINPLGGCLPMLLQMPVWFALYRTLWTAVDLYQQKFLWIENLTAKESFPFLAIAFGLLTVVQQRLTPTTMDSRQAKIMMYVMPVMFAFFMIGLPSGLVLYIAVNSILTIVQQLVINKRQVTL